MGTKSGGGGVQQPNFNEMFGSAALWNRLNQYTPYGSVEYSGPYNNVITQNVSPELLASQNQMFGLRSGALSQLLAQYGASPTIMGNPEPSPTAGYNPGFIGYGYGANVPDMSGNVPYDNKNKGGGPAPIYNGGSAYGDIIGSLPEIGTKLPDMNYDLETETLPPAYNYLNLENLPGYENLDLSSLQAIPGEGDLMGLQGDVEKNLFERSTSLLDPVYNQEEARLAQEYTNRGMPVGTEERGEAFDMFGNRKSDAYNRAAMEAVIGGQDARSQMLADAMGLRGQGLQEQMSLFGTGMQGRQQGLSELLAQIGVGNQGRAQTLSERLAQLGAEQGARGQFFNEQMGTRGQLYNELMGTRGAEYNQLASILGLSGIPSAAGDLSQFYGPGQVDVMGGYGVNQQANQAENEYWAQLISGMMGGLGSLFGGMAASSLRYKTDFEDVDESEILKKVVSLPVQRWKYKVESNIVPKHIGPFAEDWEERFGTPGGSDGIDIISAHGVALAAIKELAKQVNELRVEVARLGGA